jgi:hypothetical protein
VALAVVGNIPLIRRIRRRHHTRDFNKTFQWTNLLIRINNGVLAISEHAPFLLIWYLVQSVFAAIVLFLVYRYWDHHNPNNPHGLTSIPPTGGWQRI